MPLTFEEARDRKSTRLNSSHQIISYAVFCLKKKNENTHITIRQRWSEKAHSKNITIRQSWSEALGGQHLTLAKDQKDEGEDQWFFFNDPATTEIYAFSPHDALPF